MIVTPFAQVSPLKSFPVSLFYLLCYLKIWQMDKLRKKKKQPPDGMRLGFSVLPEHPLRIMLALRQDQHPAGVA